MPRIRAIKPDFPHSQSMGRVSREARLCFVMLWTLADDAGRLRGSSRMLASLLYPYDTDAHELIDTWLEELEREGCIQRYAQSDERFVAILNWCKHQRIDRPTPSKLPEPEARSRGHDEPSRGFIVGREGRGREGKGEDARARVPPPLHPSRRSHLDHAYCGTRFCVPEFLVNDCWELSSDFISRDTVLELIRTHAPAWESAAEGKELKNTKSYVRECWKTLVNRLRAERKGETREMVYDCGVCGEFHHGLPAEGCKSAAHRKVMG